jgi:hypothetical protein
MSLTRIYHVDDPQVLAASVAKAGGPVFDPKASFGAINTHGVAGTYTLKDQTLTLNLTSKPWIVSWDYIANQLDSFFGKAQ